MAVLYLNERKLVDKRVAVNQEARTIQYSIYRITIVNDVLCMEKAEKLLEQAKNKNFTLYAELSQQYQMSLEQKNNLNLEVTESFLKELPAEFTSKVGLEILKDYHLIKEITNIVVKQKNTK